MEFCRKCKVIKDHKSTNADPLIFEKGDTLGVGKEYSQNPNWPNWIECTSDKGQRGWVPKQYLKVSGKTGTALCDYTANELNVKVGDEITIYKFANGWAWAKSSKDEYGWVPIENIT